MVRNAPSISSSKLYYIIAWRDFTPLYYGMENIMEIRINTDDLRKKKLFVATPCYGGQCLGLYAKSTLDLQAICIQYGIECRFSFIFNESLITRARN